MAAINQIAQTTLRKVVGQRTLDETLAETLAETDRINVNIREILDVATDDWGVVVTLVELKDIQLSGQQETRHGPPGRSRAREAREDHRRGRRAFTRRGDGSELPTTKESMLHSCFPRSAVRSRATTHHQSPFDGVRDSLCQDG